MKNSFNKRSGKFEFGRIRKGGVEEAELDDHGRPTRALALLCGPPGCGKTTLAHLLARHAGIKFVYILSNPINAKRSIRSVDTWLSFSVRGMFVSCLLTFLWSYIRIKLRRVAINI